MFDETVGLEENSPSSFGLSTSLMSAQYFMEFTIVAVDQALAMR